MNDARPDRAVAGITALALLVRLGLLWRPPLWRDEAFTAAVVSGRGVGAMLDAVRHDSAPPLSYLLIHEFARISTAPVALRMVSVIAGTCAVPVAAALGRRCGGIRPARFAAAAVAVMPAFVLSARDARMYALATTLVMLCVLLLWRAIDEPTTGRLVACGAAVALAVYTQYFAIIAVCAAVVAGMVVLRPSRPAARRVIIATATGGATLIPWLVAARPQFQHAGVPFWVPPIGIRSAVGVISQFLAGTPVDPGTDNRLALQILQGFAITAGGLGLAALVLSLRRPAAPHQPVTFLAATGVGALGTLVLASVRQPLLEARYASVLWGPLAVLVGVGLARLRPAKAASAALAAMLATSVTLSVAHLHPDAPQAAAYIDAHAGPDDYVSATPENYQLMEYYAGPRTREITHITADHVDWFWGTAAYPPDAILPAVPVSVAARGAAVFTVGNETDRPPALPRGYTRRDRVCWFGICVGTYRAG